MRKVSMPFGDRLMRPCGAAVATKKTGCAPMNSINSGVSRSKNLDMALSPACKDCLTIVNILPDASSWTTRPNLPRDRSDDGADGDLRAPARGAGPRRGHHHRAVARTRGNLDQPFYSVDVRAQPRQFGGGGVENTAPASRQRAGLGRDWTGRPQEPALQADREGKAGAGRVACVTPGGDRGDLDGIFARRAGRIQRVRGQAVRPDRRLFAREKRAARGGGPMNFNGALLLI